MVTGSIIGGGALLSGALNFWGASKSASATKSAARTAANTQLKMYEQQRKDFQPYLDYGYKGLGLLKDYNPEAGAPVAPSYDAEYTAKLGDYASSPAFAAQNAIAQRDLQRRLGASGKNYGGSAANAGAELTQRLVATDYDKYRGDLAQRYKALQGEYSQKRDAKQNEYNRLMDMVKVGQGAAGSVSTGGSNYANQASQAFQNIGAADAGRYAGLGNVIPNTVSTLSSGMKIADEGQKLGWFGGGKWDPGLAYEAANNPPISAMNTPISTAGSGT